MLAASAVAIAAGAQASETTTYQYDPLGRLVAVTSSGTVNNGLSTSIGYDPAGNRGSYVVGGVGGVPAPPPSPPPPSNQPPVANADSGSVARCASKTFSVLANDTDPEGHYPLSLVGVSYGGANGSAYAASSTAVGFDAGSTVGSAVVTYTVQDSLGAASNGILTISITSGVCQ